MNQIHKLLIGTALSTLTVAAFAQTPGGMQAPQSQPGVGMQSPQGAPAAAGVDTPRQTPDIAGLRGEPPAPRNLTAPGPTDPLVQKRNEDVRANAQYRQDKKSAKTSYKSQVKSAKTLRKTDREAANDQMKEQMHGVPAQGGGAQQP
ncbi:MAG TPA: hypothetical protein VGG24_00890 [Paraburkholderia sp.]